MLRSHDSTSLRRPELPIAHRGAAPAKKSEEHFNHQKKRYICRAAASYSPPSAARTPQPLNRLSVLASVPLGSRRRPRAVASVPRCPPRPCLGARFAAPLRRTVSPYRPPPPAAACPPCPLFQPSRPSLPPHRPILAAPSLPRRPPPLRRPGASELPLVRPGCGSAQRISSAAPLASAARAAAPVDLGCVPHPRSFSCTGRASPRWCGRGTRSR